MASYKPLFARALASDAGRLHFAAHSHHLWPDATLDAQIQCWTDGVQLADRKWDKVFGEVYPAAQANVAGELGLPDPSTLAFSPNTHELLVRLFSAYPDRGRPLRVLTTDGEFHSFRRQGARWAEEGRMALTRVPCEPFDSFDDRFLEAARAGDWDVIFLSHVFFKSGRVFSRLDDLAALASPDKTWVVVDGYHSFRAIPVDLSAVHDRIFFMAGGYKYAMAGEGCGFLHAPHAYARRPEVTGWFAEFGELQAPSVGAVGYTADANRFLGGTFDSTGIYRLNAVFDLHRAQGLSTADVCEKVDALSRRMLDAVADGRAGRLSEAEILNPMGNGPRARFIAFRHPEAQAWKKTLMDANVVTDVRDDVLRAGIGLYHDEADVDAFCEAAQRLL
ncbi:MAG: aminotransferase class V-fold PLP-dependent enzyme [Caulobacteraceae bacterium]|nr:aminotransferase class V-fold PLP-dependent enzyme [Caulobacteraceae bacterium]